MLSSKPKRVNCYRIRVMKQTKLSKWMCKGYISFVARLHVSPNSWPHKSKQQKIIEHHHTTDTQFCYSSACMGMEHRQPLRWQRESTVLALPWIISHLKIPLESKPNKIRESPFSARQKKPVLINC